MDKKAEKLKEIIKRPAPKSSVGTDPNDPWSARANIPEETISEDEILNKYLISKGLNPKTASKISKISASKTGEFDKWKRNRVHGGRLPEESENLDELRKMSSSDYKKKAKKDIHQMSVLAHTHYSMGDQEQYQKLADKIKARKKRAGISNESVDSGIPDVHGSVNATARRQKQLSARKNMHNVTTAPGLNKEDVYQDPKAATQTVFDGANNTNDTCSKSAKIVKDLYRKKMHEDMVDWEKEDKSVKTYGKKPKHDKADKEDSLGEKKPKAAAVLTGGKTLTGEPRDTIEIDPMMRVRPGQPDPTKDKDKKDDKKQDNKKDK